MGEDRAGFELKLSRFLIKDRNTRNIGGKKVGSELDPFEPKGHGTGHGSGQHGLSKAWDILNQEVAMAEQGDDGQINDLSLPNDHLLDTIGEGDHSLSAVLHKRLL